MLPPIIQDPSVAFELMESEQFSHQSQLQQGSLPVEWSLLGAPIEGMTVNTTTGLLSWLSPVAKASLYAIRVQATNEMTRDIATIELHVSPSYYVEVSTDAASYIRPSPSLSFNFFTRDMITKEPVGNKLAVLWVYENGRSFGQRRKITVKSNLLGSFNALYSPYSTDFGVFNYGGEHPSYSNSTLQGQFDIMGVNVNRRYYYFSGHPQETQTVPDAFTFTFKGGIFTNVTVTFDEVSDVEILPVLSSSTANLENNTVSLSFDITTLAAVKGRIYFSLSTAEGVTVSSSYIYIDTRYRTPKLSVSPHLLDVKTAIGAGPSFHDVTVQNVGSKESSAIHVKVPITELAVPIAPTTEYLSALPVDDSAKVSFKVSIPQDAAVGNTYHGMIGKIETLAWTIESVVFFSQH